MTGAPKKRSVEILRQLEGAERGIYSGIVGYADVGGGGDWAVIIRSCFKYDANPVVSPPAERPDDVHTGIGNGVKSGHNHCGGDMNGTHHNAFYENGTLNGAVFHSKHATNQPLTDEWTLGAGGAITALSDPVAEWEEMITKVESVLRAFGDLGSSS